MTQTDSLSRKIAGRIGKECIHPSDTFAMGAAAEIIASELAEREQAVIQALKEIRDYDPLDADPLYRNAVRQLACAALSGLGVK